jgi:VRR-NUC domain
VQSERDFMAMVLDMAELFNWRAYHTRDSRGSAAGFPDLVLVRGERLIFAELKTARGKVSDAQTAWLNALASVPGIEVHVWRPGDHSEIEHVLRFGNVRPQLLSVDTIRKQLDEDPS